MASRSFAVWLIVFAVAPVLAQSPLPGAATPARHVVPTSDVNALRVVRISDGVAIVRSPGGELEKVRIGDLVGKTKAAVKEISAGRLTLEETFTGKDGKPNRALIIVKEGERGGTRYVQRSDEPAATDAKPLAPDAKSPYGGKPAPKKPPQM